MDDRDLDVEIASLLAEEGDDSASLARWKGQLAPYVDGQGAPDALRLRTPGEPPWPSVDNPMLGFLRDRGAELARSSGIDVAIEWIANNAWFEGAIFERARIARAIEDD